MYRSFLIITVLLTTLVASGQNKTIDGLKTGYWADYASGRYGFFNEKGNYRIISTASYDKIIEETAWNVKVKYKGSTPLIWFSKNVNGRISAKDSIWNAYDRDDQLRETSFWKDGLSQWAKYYDENGNIIEHDYEDYANDTSHKLIYIDGKLFKRASYTPMGNWQATAAYYPNEPLRFSNAEFLFEINFVNNPIATKEFTINATKDMTIKSVSSMYKFTQLVTVDNQSVSFPFKIKAGTAIPLKIVVSPGSADFQQRDTLTLETVDSKTPYRICVNIYGTHIDGRKAGYEFTLSRSKDKYLIIPPMGTVLAAEITSTEGKTDKYVVSRTFKRVDLSTFPVGKYAMKIRACHYHGDYTLVVTE